MMLLFGASSRKTRYAVKLRSTVALGALFLVTMTGGASAATVESHTPRISVTIPDTAGMPRERLSFTIKVPNKIEALPAVPKPRKRMMNSAWENYDFGIVKGVPRRPFVVETLRRFQRLGLVKDESSKQYLRFALNNEVLLTQVTIRLYYVLLDVWRKQALRKVGIQVDDLDRFQQVIEILSKKITSATHYPSEMTRRIEEMIKLLRKSEGKGQIKIIELKENGDGSTVIQLEVRRGEES